MQQQDTKELLYKSTKYIKQNKLQGEKYINIK